MILFIDQGIPFHCDFVHQNIETPETRKYFALLNWFLDGFDDEVIISLHPNSPSQGWWGNKKTVRGTTQELADKADLLITHYSSTVNKYGKDKEKMFISWISLHKNWSAQIGDWIQKRAEQYGQTPVFINEEDFDDA